MRAKLALIIALASFLALVTRLASAMAGADPSPNARRPNRRAATTTTACPRCRRPACANGLDDDGDGLIDIEDPDCTSPTDTSEATRPPRHRAGATAATPAPRPRSRGAARPPSRRAASSRAARSTAANAGERPRRRHPQREPRRRQRRRRLAAAASPPRARPAAATSRWPKAADGGSQFGAGGSPTTANPTTTIAPFGPAPIGVPNFVIDSFEIPPFLLPIYQACGTEYGIPWEVLASINKIETALRHQPQRLQRRRGRLDAVPPLELGSLRGRRQRRRPQGPLQPGRRDLRRRPLPQGRRRQPATSTTRSSPTTTPTGTCRRCCSTPAPTASCRPTWSAR